MPLSLTRRRGEQIHFQFPADITEQELRELMHRGISVKLADIDRSKAQIVITAPQSVNVVRSELLEDATTHPHPDAEDSAPAR